MKKLIIPIISSVFLLSLLAIAIFALNSQENAEIVKPSTFETLSSVITAEDGAYSIAKFNQKEIFADLSRDNLKQIFEAFDVVLVKNDAIEIKDTMYHRAYFDHEEIEYTLTNDVSLRWIYMYAENGEEIVLNHDGSMIISTDQDHEILKYAMLTSVYMELFPDNWTYGYTQEQIKYMNMIWNPRVCVIPDYAEYGYDSAFEAFQSFDGRTQKQFEFGISSSVAPNSTKMYKEMSDIMENSDDSYVLEYFFYQLDKMEELNKAQPMPKKDEAVK